MDVCLSFFDIISVNSGISYCYVEEPLLQRPQRWLTWRRQADPLADSSPLQFVSAVRSGEQAATFYQCGIRTMTQKHENLLDFKRTLTWNNGKFSGWK